MRAAVYARKSTAEDGKHEDAKSCTRQVEHARLYAAQKGWTIATEHVFVDDAISGALDETRRPGLRALLAAADARPRAFDVLIVAADDRLARDQWTAAIILARLQKANVALHYYLEGRQVDLSGAVGKFMEAARSAPSSTARARRPTWSTASSARRGPATFTAAGSSATRTSGWAATSSVVSTTTRPPSCAGSSRSTHVGERRSTSRASST